ncbi:hypothetical protein A6E15_19375 [Natrinema saccharevitans]|uniref:Uncharacterized protein n=1 Tax=Natrinema saccharevitans TaxID=301967 RepID=A0A1S8AR87_9EURY|nr:hypothetical protein [Natrinema saccharevitans]OLZ39126.1 hypothetical protein A6E15_19375 [Natrinema saccharevitans]
MNGRHAATDSGRYECDDDILEAAPENPVRFLTSSELVWKGMIDGITDLERLEAYRQAEKRHIHDRYDKTAVHKYIDARERELSDGPTTEALPIPRAIVPLADFEPPTESEPSPMTPADATSAPVAATDGGQTVADETDDLHPDATGLEIGEVLEFDRDETTEYVFPATAEADRPFLMRVFDEEDTERTAEPLGLTRDEVARRPIDTTDPQPIGDVDVQPPTKAATNGGAA